MNILVRASAGRERLRSLVLHRKQHTVLLEQNGVAIRIRFDKRVRQFAVEDVAPEEARSILTTARKALEKSR